MFITLKVWFSYVISKLRLSDALGRVYDMLTISMTALITDYVVCLGCLEFT